MKRIAGITAMLAVMVPGLAPGFASGAAAEAVVAVPGVANVARARQNWILKCQGCHRPDATGDARTTPVMAGAVSRFLAVDEGRAYLARVPGVATAALSDAELAELLNWLLVRFDPAHVPRDFKPYSEQEVGALRRKPLRTEAAAMRAAILAVLGNGEGESANLRQ